MRAPIKFRPFFEYPLTHNIFEGGRGGGKTRFIASLIVEVMNKAPINVICGREIQKSLKESSFLVLKQEIFRLGYADRFRITESQGVIESHTGGRAVFIGLQQHTVDSIKSYESFHWAWIEEAQSVSKNSLETLIPTLRTDGWFQVDFSGVKFKFPLRMFMYTLNPYTWDDPINLVLPESREDTRRIKINYYDNPWFPASLESERQEAKATMAPEEYQRIWEGIPYDNAENAILTRAQVTAAMERKVSTEGGIVVGADIARFGSDRTVFIKRQGLQVVGKKVLRGKDTQFVARALYDFAEGGRIFIDDTGVGGGVTDKLRDLGCKDLVPINFGAAAYNKRKYPDIISEMWFCLAEQINDIGLPDDPELLAELSSRHYKYTPDERRKVESKEDYKKRTGRSSPDCFIAGTMIKTTKGDVPIEKIQAGDRVFTPLGPQTVIKTWETKTDQLCTITTQFGDTLTGKPTHRAYTNSGFIRLDKLQSKRVVCFSWRNILLWQILSLVSTKARSITFKQLADTFPAGKRIRALDYFTGAYGLKSAGQFPKATTFTILTGIGVTIISAILNLLKNTIMPVAIGIKHIPMKRAAPEWLMGLKKQGSLLPNGMEAKRAGHGIANMGLKPGLAENGINISAHIAESRMNHIQKKLPVAMLAETSDLLKDAPLLKKYAPYVGKSLSKKLFIKRLRAVVDRVELKTVGETPVYNLTLDRHNAYYANGILVENCADAVILCFFNRSTSIVI